MLFSCPVCDASFAQKSRLVAHELSHLPWHFGKLVCQACAQRFDSPKRLSAHLATRRHQRRASETRSSRPSLQELREQHLAANPALKQLQVLSHTNRVTKRELSIAAHSAVPDIPPASDSELSNLHSELANVDWDTLFESLDSYIPNMETRPGTPLHDEQDIGVGPFDDDEQASPAASSSPAVTSVSYAPASSESTVVQGNTVQHVWAEADHGPTSLPKPPARVAYKTMPEPAPPAAAAGPTAQTCLDLSGEFQTIQTLVTSTHTDLVARISALQELVTATRAQTTGLATAITQLETNIGHHVDSLQSYQHQLCEALHTDILRVSSTLQELKNMGSKPPAPLVHSIAHLADQALQFYNAHNAPARQ